ncbi:hypothetical protein BD289DRAFT_434283 [Coniella lustricola]|uniref:Uncharacterized protein n=1 Tax=Coniella lustricola TaxID=2025994 RepID=A0A2T3A7N6_9PEZI|nr:hypothetical protein BD289DRAFT_434283 [Coniella lustricola]
MPGLTSFARRDKRYSLDFLMNSQGSDSPPRDDLIPPSTLPILLENLDSSFLSLLVLDLAKMIRTTTELRCLLVQKGLVYLMPALKWSHCPKQALDKVNSKSLEYIIREHKLKVSFDIWCSAAFDQVFDEYIAQHRRRVSKYECKMCSQEEYRAAVRGLLDIHSDMGLAWSEVEFQKLREKYRYLFE